MDSSATLGDVKLLRRRSAEPEPEAEEESESVLPGSAPKGRPTPKRRDSAPRRPAVTQAPRNRKEAAKFQRQQAAAARTNPAAGRPRTAAETREALKRGDPTALPRRDQGQERKLARDWVDSKRMLSNFLLLLFPLMIISIQVPALNFAVLILFLAFLVEWYITGRRIKALAAQRGYPASRSGPFALGFYAGSRAYMPRRWRMPAPQVRPGDSI
jgi:Protein of unknown function (DUF3043)